MKRLLALAAAVALVVVVPSPGRWKLAAAFLGFIVGNQVGVLLDTVSKKFRLIGGLILAWDCYSFFTGSAQIPAGAGLYTAAFLWGYGFLSAFPQKEMALFTPKFRERPT